MIKNKEKISVIGSLALQEVIKNGDIVTIGYLCDLRQKTRDVRALIRWRTFYSDLIAHAPHLEELRHCHGFTTTIMGDNLQAINSLVKNNKLKISYELLCELDMHSVLTYSAFGVKATKIVQMISKESFFNLYKVSHVQYLAPSLKEFKYRVEKMLEADPQAKIVGTFEKEKLISACVVWSTSKCKRIIPYTRGFFLKTVATLFSRFKYFPSQGRPLGITYMTPVLLREGHENSMIDHQEALYVTALSLARSLDKTILALPAHYKGRRWCLCFSNKINLYEVCMTNDQRLKETEAIKSYFDFSMS